MTNFLQSYNPAWKTEFEALKRFLTTQLEGFAFDVQHIGSTAVPGLLAKPVLDIDIIIHNKTLLHVMTEKLIGLGYVGKGEQGIPGRFAFRQTNNVTPQTATTVREWQEHHLYICFSDSLALKNHLAFRDALLKSSQLSEQYAAIKKALVAEPGMTRAEYTKRKTDFILSVLQSRGVGTNDSNQIEEANA